MSYIVISSFKDLEDNEYLYKVGDMYPREGIDIIEISKERIDELQSNKNKKGRILIRLIEPGEMPEEKAEEEKTSEPGEVSEEKTEEEKTSEPEEVSEEKNEEEKTSEPEEVSEEKTEEEKTSEPEEVTEETSNKDTKKKK